MPYVGSVAPCGYLAEPRRRVVPAGDDAGRRLRPVRQARAGRHGARVERVDLLALGGAEHGRRRGVAREHEERAVAAARHAEVVVEVRDVDGGPRERRVRPRPHDLADVGDGTPRDGVELEDDAAEVDVDAVVAVVRDARGVARPPRRARELADDARRRLGEARRVEDPALVLEGAGGDVEGLRDGAEAEAERQRREVRDLRRVAVEQAPAAAEARVPRRAYR